MPPRRGPQTIAALKERLEKREEIHIHQVVATSNGYVRFFLVTSAGDYTRYCEDAEKCLRLEYPSD